MDEAKFPDMKAMTDVAHSLNLTAGWYGNNCDCKDHCSDVECFAGDVNATLAFGFVSAAALLVQQPPVFSALTLSFSSRIPSSLTGAASKRTWRCGPRCSTTVSGCCGRAATRRRKG